MKSLLEE